MIKSRLGFLTVGICFALPWIGLSCGGRSVKILSGFDLIGEGGPGLILLLAFLAALVGLIATWKVFGSNTSKILRISTYISLAAFLLGFISFIQMLGSKMGVGFGKVLAEIGGDMIKKPNWTFGLWGVCIGYVFTIMGVSEGCEELSLESSDSLDENKKSAACTNCNKVYEGELIGLYCEECGAELS